MYPVSDAFKAAVESNTRKYYWHGTISTVGGADYQFTDKDIVKGSGYITRQCCGNTEIELGTVYSAEMGITLFSDIDRYTLEDAVIKLYFTLVLADGSEETIPMGVFEVTEANRKINCLEIKGYDYMLRFEKNFHITNPSGNAYHYLSYACKSCGVELAQTEAEIKALPNGNMTLGIYTDNDIETFRDLLYYTAQVLGCFCQINREGQLELVYYGDKPLAELPVNHRYSSSYSDFVTRYTAVSSTNMRTEEAEYYALATDDALTLNLGINPLLQFGLKATRQKLLTNILNCLAVVNYVPFDSTTIGNPAFDPGDVISCTGGHADGNKLSCITSITYNIGGKHTLKGVGKNPRLASAKSKNDKNISALLSSMEASKTVVYNYINEVSLTIGDSATEILAMTFTTKEETTIHFLAEILLTIHAADVSRTVTGSTTYTDADGNEVTTDASFTFTDKEKPELKVTYQINNEVIDSFYPINTCVDGRYILTLFFPISQVVSNSENTFSVLLEISNGSAGIDVGQIRANLSGQGLVGVSNWNGRITVNERIPSVSTEFFDVSVKGFHDEVAVTLPVLNRFEFTTSLPAVSFEMVDIGIVGFNERLSLDETVKTFTLDSTHKGDYDANYLKIYFGTYTRITSYTVESEQGEINSGSLEKLAINTQQFDSISGMEVTEC